MNIKFDELLEYYKKYVKDWDQYGTDLRKFLSDFRTGFAVYLGIPAEFGKSELNFVFKNSEGEYEVIPTPNKGMEYKNEGWVEVKFQLVFDLQSLRTGAIVMGIRVRRNPINTSLIDLKILPENGMFEVEFEDKDNKFKEVFDSFYSLIKNTYQDDLQNTLAGQKPIGFQIK